jgi:hypothetical protein
MLFNSQRYSFAEAKYVPRLLRRLQESHSNVTSHDKLNRVGAQSHDYTEAVQDCACAQERTLEEWQKSVARKHEASCRRANRVE